MEIVKFENGEYGVMKKTFFGGERFLNLSIPTIWKSIGDPYFNQAMTQRKEIAQREMDNLKDWKYKKVD